MHRLLEQQVAGSVEHPMAELAGSELAERDVKGTGEEAHIPDLARFQRTAQSDEHRIMNHILVHSEEDPLCRCPLNQKSRLFGAAGKWLFDKNGDARLD